MKIAFCSRQLGDRGTEVALYDYAHFNETLLGNQSVILSMKHNSLATFPRFVDRFPVFLMHDAREIDTILERENADALYVIKAGHDDGVVSHSKPTFVHCVFNLGSPHGTVYAAISETLRRERPECPCVPHMIHLPDSRGDLRASLGIPADAVVFGRHGGNDTFDLRFVHKVVRKVVAEHPAIYFLFLNTDRFAKPHPQIIHLPATFDLTFKTRFVQSCDAMLHARRSGETFGLAPGEFSIKNKPVISWAKGTDLAHLEILQDKATVYSDARELTRILTTFDRESARQKNWDAYSRDYAPEVVMARFKSVFLSKRGQV